MIEKGKYATTHADVFHILCSACSDVKRSIVVGHGETQSIQPLYHRVPIGIGIGGGDEMLVHIQRANVGSHFW